MKTGDKIRAAYNRTEYLDERRKMMQDYADILDAVRIGAAPIQRAATAFG